MKRNFFDTGFMTFAGIKSQLPRVIRYVAENRDIIVPPELMRSLVQSIRTILKNPMAEFFNRIVTADQLNNFATIYIQSSETAIPEIIASQNFSLDFKQVQEANILRSIPEFNNKVLVNLTTALKPDRVNGGLMVSAADTMQYQFCKAQLVASYADLENWLTPYLSEFVVRTYSMIISSIISRQFGLTLDETMKIMGVSAIFYSQLLGPDNDDLVMPAIYNRCTFIGSRAELTALAEEVADISSTGLDVVKLCTMMKKVGPDRMKAFEPQVFLSICGSLGPDLITGRIALEYPPYWVYCLLLALSGVKTPMIYQLNNSRLSQEGRSRFLSAIMSDEQLFNLRR